MSSSSCHFCAHGNPAGSKFCNECGSPLDLKPCSKCEAMNHVAVDRCYQCGTPFAPSESREFAEAGADAGSTFAFPAAGGDGRADSRVSRAEPGTGLHDRIPVALSERIEPVSPAADPLRRDRGDALPAKPALSGASVDDDAWSDTTRSIGASRNSARVRERRTGARGALAGVAVCAFVAAGYYAYRAQILPSRADVARLLPFGNDATRGATSSSATPAAPRTASPATAPASAAVAPAPAATAEPGSTASVSASPVAAPPASTAPAASATSPLPATTSPRASTTSTPASTTSPPASTTDAPASTPGAPASTTSAPSSSTTRQQRAVRRSAPAQSRPNVAVKPPVDKDAEATQRLIERDLGRFLPAERAEQPPRR